MLAIIATVGWIAFDVIFCFLTAPPMADSEWWILLCGGVGLGLTALVGEILDRRAHKKEIASILAGQESHSREHDTLAKGDIAILRRLTEQSDVKLTEAQEAQLEGLERQLKELQQLSRHVTPQQRRRFSRALPQILPELFDSPPSSEYKGLRVTYGSTLEAKNYAEELSQLFGGHAITVTTVEDFTHESLNVPGLKMLVATPANPTRNDRITIGLLENSGIDYEVEQAVTGFPEITVLCVGRAVLR